MYLIAFKASGLLSLGFGAINSPLQIIWRPGNQIICFFEYTIFIKDYFVSRPESVLLRAGARYFY